LTDANRGRSQVRGHDEDQDQGHPPAGQHAAYRDTFRLLLHHAQRELGKAPSALEVTDIDAAFVGGFLDHLEAERGNSVTTRNARLAAIHSLFRFAALSEASDKAAYPQ
jgi:hypothetical protein